MQRAPTFDQYCRAAEPLAVRLRFAIRRTCLLHPASILKAALIGLAVTGCSDRADQMLTARVDTIAPGHVLVENTGQPTWESGEEWRLQEDLRLGVVGAGEGNPEEFGSVASIAEDSRGRIYVLDGQAQEIRVFGAGGEYSHSIGRPGSGPGEFGAASVVVITAGDTIVVRDDQLMRYTVFDSSGQFVTLQRRDIVGTYSRAQPTSVQNGMYLDWGLSFPDGRMGSRLVIFPVRYSTGLDVADTFPSLSHTSELPPVRLALDYGSALFAAADRQGGMWFGESGRYAFHRGTLEGDTTLTVTLPSSGRMFEGGDRERIREDLSNVPEMRDQFLDALGETWPVLSVVQPDNAGYVWVFPDLADAPKGGVVDIFDVDGFYQGRVDLPSRLARGAYQTPLVHVTENSLLVLSSDELDVPYVVRYRVIKAS